MRVERKDDETVTMLLHWARLWDRLSFLNLEKAKEVLLWIG